MHNQKEFARNLSWLGKFLAKSFPALALVCDLLMTRKQCVFPGPTPGLCDYLYFELCSV